MGSLSHVASHSVSEAGRCRCLWKISSQLICPTLGNVRGLASAGAFARSMLRSTGRGGCAAIVLDCFFSILLHAARQLRIGSRGLFVLRFCVIAWAILLRVVCDWRRWLETSTQKGVCGLKTREIVFASLMSVST